MSCNEADEEVFLAQAQFLAGRVYVRPGKERGWGRSTPLLSRSAPNVVAGIEGIEQDRIDGLRGPGAQRVDAGAAPADTGVS